MRLVRSLARLTICAIPLATGIGAAAGEATLPVYRTNTTLDGDLHFSVEDGLTKLAIAWAEGFGDVCPRVNLEVAAKFKLTAALDALAAGTYGLLPLSREFSADEFERFQKAAGHAPIAVRVASRAIPLFVAADNPIAGLTLAQLEAIFSTSRKRGAPIELTRWGQLGLTGVWAEREIAPLGRDGGLAVHREFREAVLSGGEYRPGVVVVPADSTIAEVLKRSPGGIGYDRPGTVAVTARAVRVFGDDGKAYEPTDANVQTGKYPLVRPLLVYVNRAPGRPLPPAIREFVKFLLSKQGQELMAKGGFVPSTASLAAKERAKVE